MQEEYINSDGEKIDIKGMNNFHLINALMKSAVAKSEAGDTPIQQVQINVSVLKKEVLERLAPKEEE